MFSVLEFLIFSLLFLNSLTKIYKMLQNALLAAININAAVVIYSAWSKLMLRDSVCSNSNAKIMI